MSSVPLGCLIGLDLGTSVIKGIIVTGDGRIIAREHRQTEYCTYNNGWVEFESEDYYILIAQIIRDLVKALPSGYRIEGVSMASASGNTVLLDKYSKPLIKAISWMDTRVSAELNKVFSAFNEEKVYEIVGWPLVNMFPLAHLSWLKCCAPEILNKASCVCMTTDYVNYRLTGNWGIDPSTATTFYLQDQLSGEWYKPFLSLLGITKNKLPPILPSGSVMGKVAKSAAEETGLPTGTPIVLGAFDHPCAARGAGVLEEGSMLLSCGTSWVGFYPAADRELLISNKMIADPFLQPEGPWGGMFSLPSIGKKIDRLICRWISDSPDRYKEFDRLAAEADPGAGGLIIDPMQEEPELGTKKKQDIARAIMEGTAFLLKSRMDILASNKIGTNRAVMVGGPSETYPWPQIVCDVLGLKLDTVYGSCAGAVGAAMLAGTGVGMYSDQYDASRKMSASRILRNPDMQLHAFYMESSRQCSEF
jgi:xylulokinase